MKLPVKAAGLCGSMTFLITAMPGFYQQIRPTDFSLMATHSFSGMAVIETLILSLLGSIVAGAIGYKIGEILAKPQGIPKSQKKEAAEKPAALPVDTKAEPEPEELASGASSPLEMGEPMPDEPLEPDLMASQPETNPLS